MCLPSSPAASTKGEGFFSNSLPRNSISWSVADRPLPREVEPRAVFDTLTPPEPGIPADHQEYVRTMLDLLVAAFQSDATRVVTFMLDHGQSNRYFNFIPGVRGTWHALSHYKNASGKTEDDDGVTSWSSPEEKQRMYSEVVRWHHRQVAYLLRRLRVVQEPDGRTLLDNSMIVYGATLGDGNEHDPNDLPTLLAGGGGTIWSGRALDFAEPTDLANLHLSLLQRTGVPVDSSTPMHAIDA